MGDWEDKLSKAREKLDKFRKKKQKLLDPTTSAEDVQSFASSASSPLMFQIVKNPNSVPSQTSQIPDQEISNATTDTAVAEAEFEVILQPSTDISEEHQDGPKVAHFPVTTLTIANDQIDDLSELSFQGNGLPPMAMEEIPNVTEETSPQVVPIQTFQDEDFQIMDQPNVTPDFSCPNPAQVEVQSLNLSSMPTQFTPETPTQAELLPAVVEQPDVAVTASENDTDISTTESLKQLSSHLSGLLAEESNFSSSSSVVSQNNYGSKVMELEQRNQELLRLLEEERQEKENAREHLCIVQS